MTVLSRLFVPTQSKRLNELIGILLLMVAVLMALALASYSPLDRSLDTVGIASDGRTTHNWIGLVGSYSSDLILQAMGVVAFLLPVMLSFWRFAGCARTR
jgi:S-DNA-T family DNA segregation ATPase FtsK/SpoIIIE